MAPEKWGWKEDFLLSCSTRSPGRALNSTFRRCHKTQFGLLRCKSFSKPSFHRDPIGILKTHGDMPFSDCRMQLRIDENSYEHKKNPGCLGCIGGYATLCYRVYIPLWESLLSSQDSMESGSYDILWTVLCQAFGWQLLLDFKVAFVTTWTSRPYGPNIPHPCMVYVPTFTIKIS